MRRAVLIVVMASWLVGCGSGPKWYHPVKTGSSPTGNLGLELDLANPQEQQYARYRVQPDGTLLFWGGRDAILDNVTWKGTLPDSAAAELDQLVRSGGWFASPPRGDGVGDDVWTISILEPTRRRDFTVHGHVASVDDAWAILQSTASARFKATLDALPQASIETLPYQTPASGGDESNEEEQP
jgi:hypothetical protein